ncbi:MAG TPA: hypothetical protein VJI32_04810 [Candidatus Nanoarchaeia archaeon]|nr:hypothetical protein [Candidatus Nanoarchaeia archaeon]
MTAMERYHLAHEFFVQNRMRAMRVGDWERLFEYTQMKKTLLKKMGENGIEHQIVFLAATLSPIGTQYLQKEFPTEYQAMQAEIENYRIQYKHRFEGKIRELQQRMEEYPLNRVAAEVLIRKNLSINVKEMGHLGECNRDYAIFLNRNLPEESRDITLLHECGHLFYSFDALPAEDDELFKTPDVNPIEALLDQEAERALQGDGSLAGYVLSRLEI